MFAYVERGLASILSADVFGHRRVFARRVRRAIDSRSKWAFRYSRREGSSIGEYT